MWPVCSLNRSWSRRARTGCSPSEHFSVDGTLIRAWASHKSFVPKDGAPPPASGIRSNPEVDFKGQTRTNDTHESRTDPDCRLFTKSDKVGAIPCYMGHTMTENRSHLVVDSRLTIASGTAEREAAIAALGWTKTRCKERFIRKIRANFNKLLELICDGILKHTVPRACQDFTATTMPIIIRAIPTKYCG